MGKLNLEGVLITPLKRIFNPKGDILHGIKKNDHGYAGFGEAYFSMIKKGEIKGWNRHRIMTLNLIVPIGEVTFVICDERNNHSSDSIIKVSLSRKNYKRLTIPPGLWLSFKGCKSTNLILNLASIKHDKNEIERLDLNQIDYDWD